MSSQVETLPAPWKAAYQDHLHGLLLRRFRILIPLITFFILLDGAVQFVTQDALFDRLLWARLGTIATTLAILIATFLPHLRRYCYAMSLAGVVVVAADVEAAILASGGYESPFQTGLALLLIGVGLFLPYTVAQMSLACAVIWVLYLLPALISSQVATYGSPTFQTYTFFLVCSTAIAMASSIVTSRLRRQAFFARRALWEQEEKSERLLLAILPEPIARRLRDGDDSVAEGFDEVTVLFADIVGFTRFAEQLSPAAIVIRLNELFSAFDDLVEKHGVEKIKTIGDAYMAAAGVPVRRADHAEAVAELALEMLPTFAQYAARHAPGLRIRIGVNTGPVVAGVIGKTRFIYDLWGDTVNTASRMESHGVDGRIQVTAVTHARLRDTYEFEARGPITVKDKGEMLTYFLMGRKGCT